jgi:hypothetical protein
MNKVIDVLIKDKIAMQTNDVVYVCGNSDFVINFTFDAEWDEFIHKTARFIYNGTFIDVVFSGNQCAVPIISDTFKFMVGVFAGELRTTTPAMVSAKKSILCGTGNPADPAPDVYNQVMGALNQLDERITELEQTDDDDDDDDNDDGSTAVLGVAKLGTMKLASGSTKEPVAPVVVGIESIEQTVTSTEDGGVNEITATLTNGETSIFYVKNGKSGTNGKNGSDGVDGKDGSDGVDGKTAYEYAKDGGYTGTEEEFALKMAQEIPDLTVANLSTKIETLFPDQITWVLRDFRKSGKVCSFTIQFNVTEAITSSYSFTVFTLPFKSAGRVWLNNATQYFIAENSNKIQRNSSSIATGNVVLSGMYLTNE